MTEVGLWNAFSPSELAQEVASTVESMLHDRDERIRDLEHEREEKERENTLLRVRIDELSNGIEREAA